MIKQQNVLRIDKDKPPTDNTSYVAARNSHMHQLLIVVAVAFHCRRSN